MKKYVGLKVWQKDIWVCVIDDRDRVIYQGIARSEHGALTALLRKRAANAEQIGFQSHAMTRLLWHELRRVNIPLVCVEENTELGSLSVAVKRSNRNDARAVAELVRAGRYREIRGKSEESRIDKDFGRTEIAPAIQSQAFQLAERKEVLATTTEPIQWDYDAMVEEWSAMGDEERLLSACYNALFDMILRYFIAN